MSKRRSHGVRGHATALVVAAAGVLMALAAWPMQARAQTCPISCTQTGIVNDYWPATASAAAGSTTITLGSRRSGGAGLDIQPGDFLLVIQMQDALIHLPGVDGNGNIPDTTAGINYGGNDGTARGYTNAQQTGLYEYVRADSVLGSSGGTLTLKTGLINTYTVRAQNATTMRGSFQVVRIPYCRSMTLSGTVTAPAWNGRTGGIVALNADTLIGGGAVISVDGLGFRGGATDVHNDPTSITHNVASSANAQGQLDQYKGEGIAGTPDYVYDLTDGKEIATSLVFPGGYRGKGAPANAGGGGANDSGGGGGGNGGHGGHGGIWSSSSSGGWTDQRRTAPASGIPDSGRGGVRFAAPSSNRLILGGGGGGGSSSVPSTLYAEDTVPLSGVLAPNYFSRGGSGGGIVLVSTTTRTGALTINANGKPGTSDINTRMVGGGGGAGGSIVVYGTGGTITANAIGGSGEGFKLKGHSSYGGGGGGGVIGGVSTATATGGSAGCSVAGDKDSASTSCNDSDSYSSQGGTPGVASLTMGTQPGTATCPLSADLSVTKTNTPGVNNNVDQTSDTVVSGSQQTYVITVTNHGPDAVPAGTQVLDTVGSSLTCPDPALVSPAVACTNETGTTGCASPTYAYNALKTAPGILLGPMANGDKVKLAVVCRVD